MPKSGVLKSYPIKTEGTAATKKQRFLFFPPSQRKTNILPDKTKHTADKKAESHDSAFHYDSNPDTFLVIHVRRCCGP